MATKTATEKFIDGKYYVVDGFATKVESVSGPFDTFDDAEKDRSEWNCAEDYWVVKFDAKTPRFRVCTKDNQ